MNKTVPFSFNFLFYAGMASIVPYFVLYYQQLGFSGAEISILAGLPPLVTIFFSPFWTNLADRTGRHKLIMSVGCLMVIAVDLLFPTLTSFSAVLFVVLLINIFISPVSPLADSATMHMLTGQREMYGRIRIGGTIGWGVASPIAGALIRATACTWASGQARRSSCWCWFFARASPSASPNQRRRAAASATCCRNAPGSIS